MDFLSRFVLTSVWFLTALFVLAWLIISTGLRSRLKRHGVQTRGRVVRLSEDSEGGYKPIIQFYTQQGELQQFTTPGSSTGYRKLLDQEVEVVYDPNKPSRAILVHKSNRGITYAMIFLIVASLATGVVFWFVFG